MLISGFLVDPKKLKKKFYKFCDFEIIEMNFYSEVWCSLKKIYSEVRYSLKKIYSAK